MQTQPLSSGTFDVSLDPLTNMTNDEISAQIYTVLPNTSLHFPPNPMPPTNQLLV
jgi:hypothetical protein